MRSKIAAVTQSLGLSNTGVKTAALSEVKPVATIEDLKQPLVSDKTVFINDVLKAHDSRILVSHESFLRCNIIGPAVLDFQPSTIISNPWWEEYKGFVNPHFCYRLSGTPAIGSVGVEACVFENCYFYGLGAIIWVPPQSIPDSSAASQPNPTHEPPTGSVS